MNIDEMAHEIAEDAAKCVIETSSMTRTIDGVAWLNLADDFFNPTKELELELRYLEMRGILCWHPTEKLLVRIRTMEERSLPVGVKRRYDDLALMGNVN